jgi:hypothetical protein
MKKYRPYLTPSEIQEISLALKQSPTPARLHIAQYLERFILEINHGIRESSYTPKPRPTLSQELGFDPPTPNDLSDIGKVAYKFYQEHGPESCTPKQLQDALSYMYLNDLMTPEQEKEYENNPIL